MDRGKINFFKNKKGKAILLRDKRGAEGDIDLFKTILITGTVFFVILGIVIFVVYFDFNDWFGGLGGPFKKIGSGLGEVWDFLKDIPGYFKKLYNADPSDLKKRILEGSIVTKTKAILGFDAVSFGKFFYYFFIGSIAGLMVWIAFHFKEIMRYISEKGALRDVTKPDFREEKDRWLELVGGHIWKVPLVGIAYGLLMMIPIINRVLQIVTLEFWGLNNSWFARPLIIAFLIGYIPALVDKYMVMRVKGKYEKAITKAKRLSILAEQSEKEKRES